MKSAKTDRLLRAAMGLLMVGLVYVIYAAIHEHIVVAGDDAPSSPSAPKAAAPSPSRISEARSWS